MMDAQRVNVEGDQAAARQLSMMFKAYGGH